ncbi:hypothetical protein ONZ45_g1633 [Pleurotus djamor]|nr:hypothetical protein ONZ45_g1633 [Pleurotus djamor]
MFYPALLVAFFSATLAYATGQIPIIDDVVGGVPKDPPPQAPSLDKITHRIPGSLRVTENSGVCETTAGVYQASGYATLAPTENIWFWYFEARNEPENAPLALWFNGGPGASSMIGLFQENGPCRIRNDSSDVDHNPLSWNNHANVLYIDQPIGVGFSYGTMTVGTSQQAAEDVWKFLQIFFKDEKFSKLLERPLAIWTESYGGHYGPAFAAHILDQNDAIAKGAIDALHINLKALAIGNGLTDPLIQYQGYIDYAGKNPYYPLVSNKTIQKANETWTKPGGCRDKIKSCYANDDVNPVCTVAQLDCNSDVAGPLAGDWNIYYILAKNPDAYPPGFEDYLNSQRAVIGAEVPFEMVSYPVYVNFAWGGDWMRNFRPYLEKVINADGMRTFIYDGDADFICNYMGVESMVDALQTKFTSQYKTQEFQRYSVRGQEAGLFKSAGSFSYLRIFGSGHEVPAYSHGNLKAGEVADQFFRQIMMESSLHST